MGMKTVRLREDVYERIRSQKRADETFSDAIDRLTRGPSLLDLEETLSDAEAHAIRDAIVRSRDADRRAARELYGDERS